MTDEKKKIRVLVVDDSSMVRKIYSEGLNADPMIEVVATAPDPYVARDNIVKLRPDVLTLDVEMPRMDGVEFLRKLMPQYPLPVVMVSSLTQKGKQITIDALEAGAIDFVSKPTANIEDGLSNTMQELRTKIKIASVANVSHWKSKKVEILQNHGALAETTNKIIAIGASTGGTEALRRIINALPASMPGIVVVQHMPPDFTRLYANSLNRTALMEVVEGKDGDKVTPGKVIIAPGGQHLTIARNGGQYFVNCQKSKPVNGHCPSVNVLFDSVAKNVGANAYGAILTGMGEDGAKGMLAMKEAGAINIAQDENSCVVFGMPKKAIEAGGIDQIIPIDQIAKQLIENIKSKT